MATGRVQVGFFHIWTRLAGLSQKSEPGPFIKRVFSLPQTRPVGPPRALRAPSLMPSQAQNQKHKLRSMIFRPKITNTNTNTNPNTITNINTEILNTNFGSMIFPFKITITNTNSYWEFETNWTQKKKKKKKKKKMEIEVERGREAMGEEDERGRLKRAVRQWGRTELRLERVESCRLVIVWRHCEIGDGLPVLDCLWPCETVSERAETVIECTRQWAGDVRMRGWNEN